MTQRMNDDFDLGVLSHEFTIWRKTNMNQERFGQRVWNLYGMPGQSWPELFYEKNPQTAYSMLAAEAYDMWAKQIIKILDEQRPQE